MQKVIINGADAKTGETQFSVNALETGSIRSMDRELLERSS